MSCSPFRQITTIKGRAMKDKMSRKEESKVKQRRWQAHIEAWVESGLCQNEYCRQYRLSSSQFCYWKKKLKQSKSPAVNFVPLPACISREGTGESSKISSGVSIIIDGDVRISLEDRFSTQALADAISVLRS